MRIVKVSLFGPLYALQLAKGILENHPLVRRVDEVSNKTDLRLILSKPVRNDEIVGMLAYTGLKGIQIETEQKKAAFILPFM